MARYIGARCKVCRRESVKLFLKGERCYTKCPIDKTDTGKKGYIRSGPKKSEYAKRLREKQRAKKYSGILERQFRRYFHQAERMKGLTGENLLQLIEMRLDNIIRRMGFASSQQMARQLVRHGHVKINDKCVNIPSCAVQPGDVISLSDAYKNNEMLKKTGEEISKKLQIPSWLEVQPDKLQGKILKHPSREEMAIPVEEQLIVELYSK
ncbi:MAG: 30S ribosomal protein S4 [Elusimicrobia bacterium]|nr:30S ribosomal protein S4 [Elusimicrobiota bacterium]MBD3412629.1 30S ribosomal protein S4 [Elusimicrobiota bacterium]